MAAPRSAGRTSLARWPSMRNSPPSMPSSPAIMRSSVDLPQPDGPTKTMNSPSCTSRSTPRMTSTSPKALRTPCRLTLPISVSPRPAAGRRTVPVRAVPSACGAASRSPRAPGQSAWRSRWPIQSCPSGSRPCSRPPARRPAGRRPARRCGRAGSVCGRRRAPDRPPAHLLNAAPFSVMTIGGRAWSRCRRCNSCVRPCG